MGQSRVSPLLLQRRMLSHPRPDVSTGTAHRWPQFKRPRSRPCGSGGSLPASSRPADLTLSCCTSVVWPAFVWAVSRAATRHRRFFQTPVDGERQGKHRALHSCGRLNICWTASWLQTLMARWCCTLNTMHFLTNYCSFSGCHGL